jgi:hypothetical protein
VNFLLHRHLAARDLGSPMAGIGAMLPDLWRMADRRVRPLPPTMASRAAAGDELDSILAGIDHHLQIDRWFHAADVFREGERLTFDRFRGIRFAAPKLGLFAHIAWELCLDGALVRRDGLDATLDALRNGFAAATGPPADDAASLHHFDRIERTAGEREAFDAGMRQLFTEIGRGPWVAGYQDGAGVARRIDGIRVRLGFNRLTAEDRVRLGLALDELAPHADAALGRLEVARTLTGG